MSPEERVESGQCHLEEDLFYSGVGKERTKALFKILALWQYDILLISNLLYCCFWPF